MPNQPTIPIRRRICLHQFPRPFIKNSMSRTARKSWSPGSQRRRDSLFALCFWFYFVSLLVVSTTSEVAAFLSPSSIAHHNNYNPHSLSSSSSSSAVTRSSTVTPGRGPEPARLLLRTAVLRRHFPTTASSTVGACGRLLLAATTTATGDDTAPVPFLIERIQGTPSCKALYTEIAAMCIDADCHARATCHNTIGGFDWIRFPPPPSRKESFVVIAPVSSSSLLSSIFHSTTLHFHHPHFYPHPFLYSCHQIIAIGVFTNLAIG